MFIVAIIGQKGGTGKTTTAEGLAVAATKAGKTVAVIDLDQQATAANWSDRREADSPAVVSAQVARLRHTLDAARESGAEFVVIDTPGKSDSAAIDAAKAANLVLVPSRPKIKDLETLHGIRDLLRVAGDPRAFVVLNYLHPSARRSADEAKGMVAKVTGIPACPVHLTMRDSYSDAPATGRTAGEIDPKAADEMDKLYMFVCEHANMGGSKHGR